MPKVTTTLRVFLSSPDDLYEERNIFKDILDEANQILSNNNSDVRFELVMWETDTYPSLGKDAQTIINSQIDDNYDIFVGLMWTRFGTQTPRAGSGTEEEFNLAFKELENDPSNTRILFYFKDSSPELISKVDIKQLEKVFNFKEHIRSKGLVWDYKNLEEFRKLARNHLLRHAQDFRKGWGFNDSEEVKSVSEKEIDSETFLFPENNNFERNKQVDGIRIFPSKKVYARINLGEFDNWRKEFTVRYPIIEGIKSESVAFKINSILSYEKVFDVSLSESIEGDTWLNDLDYEINFVQKPFLNLTLYMEGIGAYPWTTSQTIIVNFETGEQIKVVDFFREDSLERLASIINEFVQLDLRQANLQEKYIGEISIEENLDSNEEENIDWLLERFGHTKVTVEDLDNFSIDKYGITFIYDFGFPHVIKALEPEGRYYFEYSSLKQFIKKNSVIEKFIQENFPEIFE